MIASIYTADDSIPPHATRMQGWTVCEIPSLDPPRVSLMAGLEKGKEKKENAHTEQVSSFSRSPRPGPPCGSVDIERLDHRSVEAMGRETWKKRNRGLWSEEKRGSHAIGEIGVHSSRVKMPPIAT